MYNLLYWTHVGSVLLSVSGFLLRGYWMIVQKPILDRKLVRVLPHIVDTVLLSSAIALAWLIGQYPLVNDWLTVKVVALVIYIGLGMVALRRGKTRRIRVTAFALALATVGFMVSVALSHHPLGVFALV